MDSFTDLGKKAFRILYGFFKDLGILYGFKGKRLTDFLRILDGFKEKDLRMLYGFFMDLGKKAYGFFTDLGKKVHGFCTYFVRV